jgi:3-oxoacyl-[acyl-carrier-protein] synthase II
MRRVVVTGLGVVAPNGCNRPEFWNACVNGVSGVGPITAFDPTGYPAEVAGEVKNFCVDRFVSDRKMLKLLNRHIQLAVGAAHEAAGEAGLAEMKLEPARFGVAMGSGVVPMDLRELGPLVAEAVNESGELDMREFGKSAGEKLFPLWLLRQLPNMLSSHLAIMHHAEGPSLTVTTACAAGTQAIGEAFRLVARGDADVMLAGGSDSRIEPLMIVAYGALGALSVAKRSPAEISRPFDRSRDGFVLGEGAAVLVLEEYQHARRRKAEIYAEIVGYGSSCDALGVTKPDPKGVGAARAMEAALREANLNRDDIDYISAHGTSTKLNDYMETNAVKGALGADAAKTPVSSIKSMIGHLIGAAGAVEAVASAMTLKTGVLPPTINLHEPDPQCDLDYVPNVARPKPTRCVLSNSFGFGGQNASLIMTQV